ncbi:MAG: hypothetical protein MRZ17_02660 [Acholeplasmataceae bacterium]|nr:hypothetical protein [Acholeplasmataceae bacterium]
MKYILGVDGGNTKTDYYLFDVNGNFIDMYRGGTCSHEGLKDSFEGSYRIMKEVFDDFLPKHNLKPSDITASVFGLAGDDLPYQQKKLEQIVERLGFKNFKIVNDSALGIKVGTSNGYGVCSINGTGTSVSGIDKDGKCIQVGGIGEITGDEAGGKHLSRKVVRKAFDEVMRHGDKTSLTPIVLELLDNKDHEYLMEDIALKYLTGKVDYNVLTIACFEEASKGDIVAINLLKEMADNLARSAAGAVVRLNLGEHPEIVLAGSVYVKGSCPILVEEFKEKINHYAHKECKTKVLMVPPATGAIVWAMELATGKFPSLEEREQLIKTVEMILSRK